MRGETTSKRSADADLRPCLQNRLRSKPNAFLWMRLSDRRRYRTWCARIASQVPPASRRERMTAALPMSLARLPSVLIS